MKANFDVLLSEYPSGMRINSLLISKYFHIDKSYAVVGNGAAELIKSLMRYLDGKVGVVFPTFEEYPNRYAEGRLVEYIPQNADFTYSALDLKAFFADKSISTLLLINPDNPSGNFIPYTDLLSLISWAEECGIRLVVDESFVDFSMGYEQNTLLRNDILSRYPQFDCDEKYLKILWGFTPGKTESIIRLKSLWRTTGAIVKNGTKSLRPNRKSSGK